MPRPRWGGGGPGLSGVMLYIVIFALVFVGVPALIVSSRLWPLQRKVPEFSIRLLREDLGKVVEMDLEEYLIGVVSGEMPADFHQEALKAQAVAARTYALYRLGLNSGSPKDNEAHVSSDFRSGQAWISPEAQRERWGWYLYFQKRRQITSAIEATRGEVLVYGGQPIFAAYHSTSGGTTQDSGAYFNDLPYLRGVTSPGEEVSPYYQTTKWLTWREVADKLGMEIPPGLKEQLDRGNPGIPGEFTIYESEAPDESLDSEAPKLAGLAQITELYSTGRVRSMEIFGMSFTGREIREKLGLRSNWFTVELAGDGLTFHVKGYGHGVGMSQYGAQAMALMGSSYRNILGHYYTGVQLTQWY